MSDLRLSNPPAPSGPGPGGAISVPPDAGQLPEPQRSVGLGRLRGRITALALVASALAAVAETLGTVVAGRLAGGPTTSLVVLLAVLVIGAAVLDSAGRTVWAGVVDRAEGRLRADLLSAALRQPVAVLGEQAAGEVLDRIDDDTWEVGTQLRRTAWDAVRTAFTAVPLWVVAGLTWWPAWLLFPVGGAATVLVARRLLPEVSRLKVEEEIAWTDHAALMEEGVAGRDDLRTVLGQAHVVRRLAALSARIHHRLDAVLAVETRITRRSGMLLHALLAVVAVGGVVLAARGELGVARLVTLFLVTSTFVGSVDQLARHLPDLQEAFGAVLRLRQMLAVEPEPLGGRDLPDGPLGLRIRRLDFAYPEGGFALAGIDLDLAAGRTLALVGRTGSGKSTLAALVSRAVEPAPGSVLLGDIDVRDLDLQRLRAAVGVVTQRTDVLAGTLAENIAIFADLPRSRIVAAIRELGLEQWVAGLPGGLDTPLGPGGTTLSAGEEQLVAFARLLVRDVRVVVLDEATARMDPLTEQRVVRAAERLLTGRTGIVVAHRLSTTARADVVAVLDDGRVVQQGARAELAARPGPFRDLLTAADERDAPAVGAPTPDLGCDTPGGEAAATVGAARRTGPPPAAPPVPRGSSLAAGIARALLTHPRWGLTGGVLFLLASMTGAFGAVTGFLWGRLVQHLQQGTASAGHLTVLTALLVVLLVDAPLLLSLAFRRYPQWWISVTLRVRMSVLIGQTRQHRLERTPPGEVVARSMDADRFVRYADRWVDLVNGLIVVAATALLGGSLLAGSLLLAVMAAAALSSALGRPVAGRSAAESSRARARFGRALVSVLESTRTVKLAAAIPDVHRHLRAVDAGRVEAAVREHRVQAMLDGVPVVMVQLGVVGAWATYLLGGWDLASALLVATAVSGFDWFGRVAGSAVTEAPGTRSWQQAASALAGGGDLMALPPGVDLVAGLGPLPVEPTRTPLRHVELRGVGAVHPDGTVGVRDVDLTVGRGELVLLLGQVGSGKSSLLGALAGLVEHTGQIRWNDVRVEDAQTFLRPGQVAAVAQVPRVLSGTFADNVLLDFRRPLDAALSDARLGSDVARAGGADAMIGHRGVRLSGGQVQRLALARALAAEPELLVADDVSSALDPTTEVELWAALRARGATVIGATSKRAALAQADRVVVLVDGRIAEVGPWAELSARWGRLAG